MQMWIVQGMDFMIMDMQSILFGGTIVRKSSESGNTCEWLSNVAARGPKTNFDLDVQFELDFSLIYVHTLQFLKTSKGGELFKALFMGRPILASSLCISLPKVNSIMEIRPIGGHRPRVMTYEIIAPYIPMSSTAISRQSRFCFIGHAKGVELNQYLDSCYIISNIPLEILTSHVTLATGQKIAELHGLSVSQPRTALLQTHFRQHSCNSNCVGYRTIISLVTEKPESNLKKKEKTRLRVKSHRAKLLSKNDIKDTKISNAVPVSCKSVNHNLSTSDKDVNLVEKNFPPEPLDKMLAGKIIKSACDAMDASEFEESGCAVCGQLVPLKQLSRLSAVSNLLHILSTSGVTRKERHNKLDAVSEYDITLDTSCDKICNDCRSSLRKNKVPRFALDKGLWLGNVPDVLSSLRFVERMLVARVRHSCCCVRIASGMRKMKANAIAFQSPVPIFYLQRKKI